MEKITQAKDLLTSLLKSSIMKQELEKVIADFESATGYKLEIRDGKPYYSGGLDLENCTGITSLPEGLTVGGYLYLYGSGITSLPNGLTVGGNLDLRDIGIILPEDLTVGGTLDLENCTGITSLLPNGLTVGGNLDLRDIGITSLPEGLTVGCTLDLENCTGITSLPEDLTVGGTLDLENCTGITSLPDGLTVGGDLYLHNSSITSLPNGLKVGGYLDLRGTGITSLPKELVVGGTLDLKDCSGITSLPNGLTVGGSIYLHCTSITSLPEGLTVGGGLDLRHTGITSLPEGLTVGGYLDLRDTGITSLPEDLTVGGHLYLYGTGITDMSNVTRTLSAEARKKISDARNRPLTWKLDDKAYIKADGIFTVIDSHHCNVYRVRRLGSEKQLYLVTDGDNHWAHGDTLQEARADLIYKINDRDTSMYDGMMLDDTLTFEEAIVAYRTITGACSPGTRDYIANRLPKPHKEKYSIGEIISLTECEYGSEKFREFFKQTI